MFYSLIEMRGAAMSFTAAASGLVVFLLSVSGTVHLHLHSSHEQRGFWENVGLVKAGHL